MPTTTVRYTIDGAISLEEVEGTLALARLAVESLYGQRRVALEMRSSIDRRKRQFVLDISTDVGRALALIFSGYVQCEFGTDAVRVTRTDCPQHAEVNA